MKLVNPLFWCLYKELKIVRTCIVSSSTKLLVCISEPCACLLVEPASHWSGSPVKILIKNNEEDMIVCSTTKHHGLVFSYLRTIDLYLDLTNMQLRISV